MISFDKVSYDYEHDNCLDNISLNIEPHEFAFLIGPTGSGKSTLLKLIYMDLFPTSGTIEILGVSSKKIKKRKVPFLRRKIGMIFQDFKLLKDRSLFENVALPLHIMGMKRKYINVNFLVFLIFHHAIVETIYHVWN